MSGNEIVIFLFCRFGSKIEELNGVSVRRLWVETVQTSSTVNHRTRSRSCWVQWWTLFRWLRVRTLCWRPGFPTSPGCTRCWRCRRRTRSTRRPQARSPRPVSRRITCRTKPVLPPAWEVCSEATTSCCIRHPRALCTLDSWRHRLPLCRHQQRKAWWPPDCIPVIRFHTKASTCASPALMHWGWKHENTRRQ